MLNGTLHCRSFSWPDWLQIKRFYSSPRRPRRKSMNRTIFKHMGVLTMNFACSLDRVLRYSMSHTNTFTTCMLGVILNWIFFLHTKNSMIGFVSFVRMLKLWLLWESPFEWRWAPLHTPTAVPEMGTGGWWGYPHRFVNFEKAYGAGTRVHVHDIPKHFWY